MKQLKIFGSILLVLLWFSSGFIALDSSSNVAFGIFISPLILILIALLYALFEDIYE